LEVPRGGAVFFTSLTIHGSFANRSATRDRLAWAVHYVKDGTWVLRADVQDTVSVQELRNRP
jgi:ectoine hydroxylase-related dioxygenase (phytanoyl-CoA dioxygenase family)